MPRVFWTGKLSLSMRLIVNASNVLAWISGNTRDTLAMKKRIKLGYEGAISDMLLNTTNWDWSFRRRPLQPCSTASTSGGKYVLTWGVARVFFPCWPSSKGPQEWSVETSQNIC